MKKLILLLAIAGVLFGCQQQVGIDDTFLVGKWYTSEIDLDTTHLAAYDEKTYFEFTANKNLYIVSDSVIIDSCSYKFMCADSTLSTNDNGKVETSNLRIISAYEFEIKDNMGLIMRLKRAE